jgi:hypothetical protein
VAAKVPVKTMLGLDAEAVRAATEAIRAARAQPGARPESAADKQAAPPISDQAKRALNQTMMGFAEDTVPRGRPPGLQPGTPAADPDNQLQAAAAAARASQARPSAPPLAAARRSVSPPRGTFDATPGPASAAQNPDALAGTMLGVSALTPASVAQNPPPASPAQTAAGTQLGMTALSPEAVRAGQHPQPADAAVGDALGMTAQSPGSASGPLQFGTTKTAGTMLGMSVPMSASSQPPDRLAGAGHGRTMLGVPLASLMPPGGKPGAGAATPSAAAGGQTVSDSDASSAYAQQGAWANDSAQESAQRSSQAPRGELAERAAKPWWPLALGVLAVIALAGMLVVRLTSHPPQTDVTARIVAGETGESLLFEVPGAPVGSRLRFGGQEQPLNAGRASFPLAADSLRVGDNVVLADVVKPNGDTTSARITLAVFYRVWVDTAALRADRSALDVVVTALPGTRVTLEGEELKLDAQGRATRSFPLDVVHQAKAGIIDHVVHYRMQPPSGETVVDELHTQIPVAMMQIDRPGMEVVTDRESIEIAGAVGRDTQVRVDGREVPVKDQRFLYSLALPKPGDYEPRVVASAAGKAPLGVTLKIRRVHDLVAAASEFVPDANLTYAKLAPNPTIYRGQSIALEGRVYAFDARAGSSVIQMLVRPCPSSQRCSLWVVDPQASEVAVDHWVRVLGTVDGEQQFRSEKNEVVTVPKIVARFILPAKP